MKFFKCGNCHRKFIRKNSLIHHSFVPSPGDFLGEGYYCKNCCLFCYPVIKSNFYVGQSEIERLNEDLVNFSIIIEWRKIHEEARKRILVYQKRDKVAKKYWLF